MPTCFREELTTPVFEKMVFENFENSFLFEFSRQEDFVVVRIDMVFSFYIRSFGKSMISVG